MRTCIRIVLLVASFVAAALVAPAAEAATWTRVFTPQRGIWMEPGEVAYVPGTQTAWAVGAWVDLETVSGHAFAMRNTGSGWAFTKTPALGGMGALAPRTASDVWAVGHGVMHWNGVAWRSVPTGLSSQPVLEDVAALAADDVWAAGYLTAADGATYSPIVLHWNGTRFARVTLPVPAAATAGTAWISTITRVPGTTTLWAAGTYARSDGSNALYTLERYQGRWHVVPAVSGAPGETAWYPVSLLGVAPGELWMVGQERACQHPAAADEADALGHRAQPRPGHAALRAHAGQPGHAVQGAGEAHRCRAGTRPRRPRRLPRRAVRGPLREGAPRYSRRWRRSSRVRWAWWRSR